MAARSASSARSRAARRPRLVGSETPRIFTPPLRKLTRQTTLGFDAIEFAVDVCGIDLYPWQRWLLVHALELDPALTVRTLGDRGRLDPMFRFRKVVVLVARQNGKSTLSQVLSLFFLYQLGTGLVLGTAQDLDTAEEVWEGALDIIEETPELAELAMAPVRNNGKKAIRLKTGERYKVKAANRRAGRGLSGDLILLDELREHQSWDAWGAITKTTMARPAAQIWALSNAGDATSVVLRYLRKQAHAALGDPDGINADDDPSSLLPGEAEVQDMASLSEDGKPLDLDDFAEDDESTLGLFEWSALPGSPVTDVGGILAANPSTGHGISMRTLLGDAKADPEWIFRTECLCQWTDGSLEGPFPPGTWDAGKIEGDPPKIVGNVKACLDMSKDRTRTHVVFAGMNDRGRPQIEVVASRAGSDWVESWLTDPKRADRIEEITGQTRGAPVSGLMADLKTAGLPVVDWGGPDLGAATGAFYDGVRGITFDHLPQPVLDVPAATAVSKQSGDAFLWDRNHSPTDIAPLVGATGALWLLTRAKPAPTVSVYESRGVLTV